MPKPLPEIPVDKEAMNARRRNFFIRKASGERVERVDINVNKKVRRAYDRKRRQLKVIEKKIDLREQELKEVEGKLASVERKLALKAKALSPADQRAILTALYDEHNLNPIEELLLMVKDPDALPAKDRASILKFLAEYQAPKPKSIDIQATHDHNITVEVVGQIAPAQTAPKRAQALPDAAYDEFIGEEDR